MGFTPEQVDRMPLWQFMACIDGYREANGGKREREPVEVDDDQLRAMGIKGF